MFPVPPERDLSEKNSLKISNKLDKTFGIRGGFLTDPLKKKKNKQNFKKSWRRETDKRTEKKKRTENEEQIVQKHQEEERLSAKKQSLT